MNTIHMKRKGMEQKFTYDKPMDLVKKTPAPVTNTMSASQYTMYNVCCKQKETKKETKQFNTKK